MPTFAAVDIGSNSVRLKIARLQAGRVRALHEDREVTRLGEGVFSSGFLNPESMAETVKVLRRFHRATQQIVTDNVRVVATSALRDARNSQAFLEWVKSATGWRVEIVSGVEEARLIHLGLLVSSPRVDRSPTLMMDLGGGSCELTVTQGGHIRDAVSLPLGAVRLSNEFLRHDPTRKGELKRLRGFVAREVNRIANRIGGAKVKNVIATSGTAAALAAVASHLRRGAGRPRPVVSRAEMSRIAKRLARLPVEERRKIEGIGPRRAEIIVAGATVYHELLDRLHLKSFRYSPLGLRDGILAQMAADEEDIGLRKQLESERQNSIFDLASHYGVDLRFSNRVADHAGRLFKLLAPMHRLPPDYASLLHAAATLHEVGSFISRAGRRRHAHYILAHSELLGFSLPQRRVIAAIARYLGKSKITPASPAIRLLTPEDRLLLPRVVVLLRLARALEQGRRAAVLSIRVRVGPRDVRLTLVTRPTGAELELWALERERAYFFEVFGRELSCVEV